MVPHLPPTETVSSCMWLIQCTSSMLLGVFLRKSRWKKRLIAFMLGCLSVVYVSMPVFTDELAERARLDRAWGSSPPTGFEPVAFANSATSP